MNKLKLAPSVLFLISFLLVFGFFSLHEFDVLRLVGLGALYALIAVISMLFAGILFQHGRIYGELYSFTLVLTLLAILYLMSGVLTDSLSNAFIRFVQIVSIISLVHVTYHYARYSSNGVALYQRIFLVFSIGMLLITVLMAGSDQIGGFQNNNALGLWLAVATIASIDFFRTTKGKFIYLSFMLLAIYITGSRTSLGAVFLGIIVYFSWVIISKSKMLFWSIFLCNIILAFFVIILFSNQAYDLDQINEISQNSTGKNFLSGRNIVWPILLELIFQQPVFGWGGGVIIGDVIGMDLSAHNFYLQLLVQVGFLGLVLFIALIFYVWKLIWKFRNQKLAASACGSFLIVLMSQNFEVTILQNNLVLSYPMWGFLGAFLGGARSDVFRNYGH